MKLVIQRVTEAAVTVDQKTVAQIEKGLLVLVGISKTDTQQLADRYLNKLQGLRIFEDADGKTNLSLKDVDGQIMMVSQFTLYANCRKGNRPSFIEAGAPKTAEPLYQYMVDKLKESVPVVAQGIFGADMKVSLINDGPFTVILDEDLFS